jgi:DNA-binding SARP family transcriptional activator
MEFRILGPLEVRDGDLSLALGGLKQRALLALLLTRAGEVVPRERLIDELWAGAPPDSATSVFQTYLSHLRKALGPEVLRTHASGYALDLGPHEFDLHRFETLMDQARRSPAQEAATHLRQALALWRGPPLADFTYEPFAQTEISRLEELRLVALEWRIETDLALGRHNELVGELEALVSKHPLREHFRGLLMLALYRAGRQAEALESYQAARSILVNELGIEPSQPLQELERAILQHDVTLEVGAADVKTSSTLVGHDVGPEVPERSIVLIPGDDRRLDAMLELAVALASQPPRELILARLVPPSGDVSAATASLSERRESLLAARTPTRIAAFTSSEPGRDTVLLASEQPTDLLLIDAPTALVAEGTVGKEIHTILANAPCDVGLLVVRDGAGLRPHRPVTVPFSGAEHDWSAIEIAAWMSRSLGTSLQLVGTTADPATGRRDASRLLARASLMVQQVVGVATEPVLVEAGHEGLIAATTDAGLLVLGLSPRWREEGLGEVRLAVVRQARPPTLLVRRGVRPGGLAPRESMTRFTWTLASAASVQ